jgi:hypothetical protein
VCHVEVERKEKKGGWGKGAEVEGKQIFIYPIDKIFI